MQTAVGMTAPSSGQEQSRWRSAGRDLLRFNWEQRNARAGLRCLPGLFLLLGTGIVTGHYYESAIAAAAALSVGFGSFQSIGESRGRVMLLVTAVMSIAAFAGSIASRSVWGVLLEAAGWAFLYGLLTALEGGLSWIGLQAVIIAVVAGGFPVGPRHALLRTVLTFGGALIQTGLILAIWRIMGPPQEPVGGPPVSLPVEVKESRRATLRMHLTLHSPVGRFAVQLAITLAVAAGVYRVFDLPNGYWAPMTAVIVLRPEFHQTFIRGAARLGGTLLGVALATLIVEIFRPHAAMLAALVLVCAWAGYALLRVNYGLFAVCITAYVVFLLSFMGLPEKSIIVARLLNTTIGGAIAIAASLLPLERLSNRMEKERVGEGAG